VEKEGTRGEERHRGRGRKSNRLPAFGDTGCGGGLAGACFAGLLSDGATNR
jgi:hypothetical protein